MFYFKERELRLLLFWSSAEENGGSPFKFSLVMVCLTSRNFQMFENLRSYKILLYAFWYQKKNVEFCFVIVLNIGCDVVTFVVHPTWINFIIIFLLLFYSDDKGCILHRYFATIFLALKITILYNALSSWELAEQSIPCSVNCGANFTHLKFISWLWKELRTYEVFLGSGFRILNDFCFNLQAVWPS